MGTTDPSGKLNVSLHHGHPLGMNGAKVPIRKHEFFALFLSASQDVRILE